MGFFIFKSKFYLHNSSHLLFIFALLYINKQSIKNPAQLNNFHEKFHSP